MPFWWKEFAMSASLEIVAYLVLFAAVGLAFLFANLLLGRFVRPRNPHPEKLEIYECGEPAIGSSFVQFDLRFYVVALVFIIFEVEAAFFFPWATVFGKANHLADMRLQVVEQDADGAVKLTRSAEMLEQELGVETPSVPQVDKGPGAEAQALQIIRRDAKQLGWILFLDMAVFFGVLLVGFAYVWKRGDLDWVRALGREPSERQLAGPPLRPTSEEPVLSV
jgi:NADH-quinone oxidoreductase subunit A